MPTYLIFVIYGSISQSFCIMSEKEREREERRERDSLREERLLLRCFHPSIDLSPLNERLTGGLNEFSLTPTSFYVKSPNNNEFILIMILERHRISSRPQKQRKTRAKGGWDEMDKPSFIFHSHRKLHGHLNPWIGPVDNF